MKIYTKKGDSGSTARPGGQTVRKSDALCDALGNVDELNAVIGWCIAQAQASQVQAVLDALVPIQAELLTLGAMVAAGSAAPGATMTEQSVTRMEKQIDVAMDALPPLEHFILPGGGELSCRLHLARTVCRRAERSIVTAVDAGLSLPELALKYINRLSDLFFALARLAAKLTGNSETLWPPVRDK